MGKTAGPTWWGPIKHTSVLLIGAAPLLALAACSGASDTAAPSRSAPPATAVASASAAPAADLDAEARAAVALVDSYTPGGYPGSSVASGYDWAAGTGQMIVDASLSGAHLFQIACAGSGEVTVHLPSGSAGKKVTCGADPVGFHFSGELDVSFDGAPTNTGTYAWRVLAASTS